MSTSVDAEQAWHALQRIRVPQERVYDEFERTSSGGPRATYTTAAIMWAFLASLGLDLPPWGVGLVLAAYVALLGGLAVLNFRRSRMQLHHSHSNWRLGVTFVAAAVVTGGTIVGVGRLVDSLEPIVASLIQATVSAVVFVLFVRPASRWAIGSVRRNAEGAGR
ncbi:hypothetical protein ACH4E8_20250 [Streptomyces sp. NPDC017979]|uniref:hypothetical protein n=1 Tax=Streptomyces sp. NPDC017979 TaxID=3365024 RepID=UPI0037BAABDF